MLLAEPRSAIGCGASREPGLNSRTDQCSAHGEPDVGYENVLEAERARREVEHIMLATAPLQAETAVVYSDRAKVFLKTEPHRGLHYRTLITEFYDRLLKMGIHRDVILEGSPLDGYKLLFTPFIHYLPLLLSKSRSICTKRRHLDCGSADGRKNRAPYDSH